MFVATACAIALSSCGTENLPQASITGSAMGTQFNITIVGSGQDSIDELAQEILEEIQVGSLYKTPLMGDGRYQIAHYFKFCNYLGL